MLVALIALTARYLAPYDPTVSSGPALAGPSWAHPFGTDENGRDLLSRVLVGTQLSVEIAVSATIVAAVIGTLLGLYSGYAGGWRDSGLSAVVDFLLGFPALVLALTMVALTGPGRTAPFVAGVGVIVPLFARVIRAATLGERGKEYVTASRALGAGTTRILTRTILPAIMPVVVVQLTVAAAIAVQLEAALSFLGAGVAPPAPSLGGMLQTSRSFLYNNPWYGVFPGLFLSFIIASLLVLGRALEGASDSSVAIGASEES
jgi:peptide/nickel transport system permease protein